MALNGAEILFPLLSLPFQGEEKTVTESLTSNNGLSSLMYRNWENGIRRKFQKTKWSTLVPDRYE